MKATVAVHSESIEVVEKSLSTNRDLGLTSAERALRLERHGPNMLPRSEGDGPWRIFFRQFNNPLVYILIGSSILALLLGKALDAAVVLGVVILNSIIGFVQEYRAGKALEALAAMVPEYASVLADGKLIETLGVNLVPGDVVFLKSGDKVPADLRLFESKSLKIEEAVLTGESVAAEKSPEAAKIDAPLGDRTSMAYSGTLVTYGTGRGVVVGTATNTELGKISKLLGSTTSIDTPLTQSLARFGKLITFAITAVAILLVFVGRMRGFPFADAVLAAVTLAVAAIPEGLPAIVTITLAIGVRRMAQRRAVIRKLPAVETLGGASVICSDKTGTLTKNEMTVQALWTPHGGFRVSGSGYEAKGQLLSDGVVIKDAPKAVWRLLKAGVLCNDSRLIRNGSAATVNGDPTEAALLVTFEKLGGVRDALDNEHKRLDVQAFESDLQYMATLNVEPSGQNIYIKGAPEVVFKKCLPGPGVDQARQAVAQFASESMRVLALARKKSPSAQINKQDLEDGFELLGLQAMIDPPRPEVIVAIKDCHSAGIVVKMITGDHKLTALAIAKQIGITTTDTVYSGDDLAKLNDDELVRAAKESNVFARVTPEQKLRLVKALQTHGATVAMTGDGVNDAPALKQANIGIAMGITGTSVSKEAADLVLVDDNFASIRAAIEEGRRIYDNLVKSLAFVLPTNLGEALIILAAVAFFPIVGGSVLMPVLPVQILWINLVATVALALPLAFESPEADVMRRPPRSPGEPIMSGFVIWRTIMVAVLMAVGSIALFFYEYSSGMKSGGDADKVLREAQTMAVTSVIFFQIFYLFNCRSLKNSMWSVGFFSNKVVYAGIVAILVLQALFVYVPFMQTLFGSASLGFESWVKAALMGALILPVIGIEKLIRRRFASGVQLG